MNYFNNFAAPGVVPPGAQSAPGTPPPSAAPGAASAPGHVPPPWPGVNPPNFWQRHPKTWAAGVGVAAAVPFFGGIAAGTMGAMHGSGPVSKIAMGLGFPLIGSWLAGKASTALGRQMFKNVDMRDPSARTQWNDYIAYQASPSKPLPGKDPYEGMPNMAENNPMFDPQFRQKFSVPRPAFRFPAYNFSHLGYPWAQDPTMENALGAGSIAPILPFATFGQNLPRHGDFIN